MWLIVWVFMAPVADLSTMFHIVMDLAGYGETKMKMITKQTTDAGNLGFSHFGNAWGLSLHLETPRWNYSVKNTAEHVPVRQENSTLITARIRRMREGTVLSFFCQSTHRRVPCPRSEGYPIPGLDRGYLGYPPPARSGWWGVPHPRSGQGGYHPQPGLDGGEYPIPGLDGGYLGYPPTTMTGWDPPPPLARAA